MNYQFAIAIAAAIFVCMLLRQFVMFNSFTPEMWAFFGAAFAVVGGFVASEKQNNFQKMQEKERNEDNLRAKRIYVSFHLSRFVRILEWQSQQVAEYYLYLFYNETKGQYSDSDFANGDFSPQEFLSYLSEIVRAFSDQSGS